MAGWITAFLLLVLFVIQFGYYIQFDILMSGQSPGKRAVGLRVVKPSWRVTANATRTSESSEDTLKRITKLLASQVQRGDDG